MAEAEKAKVQVEELEIDLSHVPLKPTSKREIQQLEMALIIGTLYRPEVIELIRDPMERATWVDSLAVAAAALARYKAGYSIRQIAEELGRSETMIRAHLHGKTKAGKLVLETYELLARGKLKLVVPFKGVHLTVEEYEELKGAKEKLKELEERIKALEEENRRLKKQLESCMPPEKVEEKIREYQKMIEELEKENSRIREELEKCKAELKEVREKGVTTEEQVKKLSEELEKLRGEVEKYRSLVDEIKRLVCG